MHGCWGAAENFKLKEIWTGSMEGQPRAQRKRGDSRKKGKLCEPEHRHEKGVEG